MQMKMKLLDYTLIGILAGMTPLAGAQEADARTQPPQDKAEGTDQLLECTDESCASQEGLLFRLRTRSYDRPVTQGTGKQSSSAELQPDRRVTVATEQPGKAVALGKFSIPLPGGYRIGLDPIIGLVPGLGDAIGALLSAFIINEARSLGAPRSILLRMIGNVAIETVLGAIPFAGDIFDAAFKANSRNLALLARYQLDPIGSRRSSRFFVFGFSLLLALVVAFVIAVPVLVIVALFKLF